ncbi:hypothetical protein SUGI_1176730 [Cryptomeria japonica]|nr:hypothetical protein SUGI_1176730 [Cryptomeria japonica]
MLVLSSSPILSNYGEEDCPSILLVQDYLENAQEPVQHYLEGFCNLKTGINLQRISVEFKCEWKMKGSFNSEAASSCNGSKTEQLWRMPRDCNIISLSPPGNRSSDGEEFADNFNGIQMRMADQSILSSEEMDYYAVPETGADPMLQYLLLDHLTSCILQINC